MLGCIFRARLNKPATSLLDSPYHLLVRTETAMFINVAPDSFASARWCRGLIRFDTRKAVLGKCGLQGVKGWAVGTYL